jgi:hypothetical protein
MSYHSVLPGLEHSMGSRSGVRGCGWSKILVLHSIKSKNIFYINMLCSREGFRNGVFKRDKNTCTVPYCGRPAEDAHHIIERRLWTAEAQYGGYFIDNGASVCEYHHKYGAETCVIQPQVLRMWIGINNVVLPHNFSCDSAYDKWGTQLKRPTRRHIKYPSTPYVPGSPGCDEADIFMPNQKTLLEQPLVFTVKMDGSNVCLTSEAVVARNGDNADHPSFGLLKERYVAYRAHIPPNIQIFGEWLFAKHSIAYDATFPVKSYLQIFSVYDQERELFLDWSTVCQYADILGVRTVPVLEQCVVKTEGELQRKIISIGSSAIDEGHEGIVIRTSYPFPYGSFEGYTTTNKSSWYVGSIAKYVRADHIRTDSTWGKKIIRNTELKEG